MYFVPDDITTLCISGIALNVCYTRFWNGE